MEKVRKYVFDIRKTDSEKITQEDGFVAKIKTGQNTHIVNNVTIRIINAPIMPSPLVQPMNRCEIIGEFEKLKLSTADKLECEFVKDGFECYGDFYYNDISKTVELTGALTIK